MSLIQKIKFIPRKRIEDSRGWFYKVINGKEENLPNFTGEVYLTLASPLQIKGEHYHHRANEWFTLIQGDCNVKLFDIETGEKVEFSLNSNVSQTLFIPSGIAHAFENTSKSNDFLLLAYTDCLYEPDDTITTKW